MKFRWTLAPPQPLLAGNLAALKIKPSKTVGFKAGKALKGEL
jgi:hypothetical protein